MSAERLNTTWNRIFRGLGWLLVAFVLVAGSLMIATTADAADVELANETVSVDADTDTAYADFNNTNSTTAATVDATFYGVESDGTETEISNQTGVSVPADGTKLVESASVNGTKYDSVRVVAVLDNTTVSSTDVAVTTGTFQQVSGGGGGSTSSGGLLLGLTGTQVVIVVVAIVGLMMVMADD